MERTIDYDATWRTDWARASDGEWWLVESVDGSAARNRIRVAAHHWAGRRGLRVQSRTVGGSRFYLRFIETERAA